MRRRRIVLAVAGAVLLAGGGISAFLLAGAHYRPRSLPVAAPSVTLPAIPVASPAVAAAIPRSAPVRVIIPAIGVNASVVPEGTDSAGALEVPPLTALNETGWWDGGAAPGQDGPAVIVGHIDSAAAGPLVFWNLHKLVAGEAIETELANGRSVWFTVTALQEVSKNAFPTQAVYGPTTGPALRLVTCGGAFDSATGHYVDNLIVYATESTRSG